MASHHRPQPTRWTWCARPAALLILLLGCTQFAVEPVPVGEVVVVPQQLSVAVSDRATLEAKVRDHDGNLLGEREVEWESLDTDVATIEADGVLTGVRPGVAVVAAWSGGVVGVAQATVKRPPKKPQGDKSPEDPGNDDDDDGDGAAGDGAEGDDDEGEDDEGDDDDDDDDDDDGDDESDDDSEDRPRAPSDLKAKRKGGKSIDVAWRDRSKDETRFELQRRRAGGGWGLIRTLDANEDKYRDKDVKPTEGYTYRVRACNGAGCSPYSGTATADPVGN